MCDGYDSDWCKDFDAHALDYEFCIKHQIAWCSQCERHCPECRLGEPEDDPEYDDDSEWL